MDAFAALYANEYILHAQLNVSWKIKWYYELYYTAYYSIFGLDDPDRESCGSLNLNTVSPYDFLFAFDSWKVLILDPW